MFSNIKKIKKAKKNKYLTNSKIKIKFINNFFKFLNKNSISKLKLNN